MQSSGGSQPLRRYRCHKEVSAAKIVGLGHLGSAVTRVYFEGGYTDVTPEWSAKHEPLIGGYYVVYDDGYASWSPAKAFEEGYTRLDS